MNLQGKTVTIMGLGQFEHGSGLAAAQYAIRQGANLIITDLKTEADLQHQVDKVKAYMREQSYRGEVTWAMGGHKDEDFTKVDLILRNPGVPIESPFLLKARAAGVPVESEMTIFFKECKAKIVGITGTRGKSTTTALIASLLQATKQNVWWGGNIGKRSPLEFMDDVGADDLIVLELSSWMLESLDEHQLSPQFAVLLNVQEDHLNRYKDMQTYAQAKGFITKHQKTDDTLVCNHANSYTREIGEQSAARVIWFDRFKALKNGYGVDGKNIVEYIDGKAEVIADASRVSLRGEHNLDNILAAVATARVFKLNKDQIENQLAQFTPLPGRIQFINEINKITFINDTTATTPSAVIAGLQTLKDRPLVVISGGADKSLPLQELAQTLSKLPRQLILLPGSGTDRLLSEAKQDGLTLRYTPAASMDEAVKQAFNLAQPGDVVVLAPAFASFGLFKNEFDRGDKFNAAVAALADQQKHNV